MVEVVFLMYRYKASQLQLQLEPMPQETGRCADQKKERIQNEDRNGKGKNNAAGLVRKDRGQLGGFERNLVRWRREHGK